MSEERIAQLVVEYLLMAAGGMVDDREPEKASASDDDSGSGRKGASGGSGKGIPVLSDIFKQFEVKLFALLAPAALVATMLTSVTSGLGTFVSVIKLIGNTFGVLLFPVIALAASVLMTFNDALLNMILPNLEDWATAILDGGIKIIDWLAQTMVYAANQAIRFGRSLAESESFIYKFIGTFTALNGQMLQTIANLIDETMGGLKGLANTDRIRRVGAGLENAGAAVYQAGKGVKEDAPALQKFESIIKQLGLENGMPNFTGAFTGGVRGNLDKFMTEFKFQNMPKPQQMSIGQANLNAQMATFQMSPFERDQLKLMQNLVDTMQRVLQKISPPTTS